MRSARHKNSECQLVGVRKTQRAPLPPQLVSSVQHKRDQSGDDHLQDFALHRLAQSQSGVHLLSGADNLNTGDAALRREAVACDKRIGEYSVCADLSDSRLTLNFH